MDSALAGLVDNCTRTVVSARCWPTPAPYDGQSRGQWAAHVARLREQQNAAALEAVRLLDNGEPRAEVGTVPRCRSLDFPFPLGEGERGFAREGGVRAPARLLRPSMFSLPLSVSSSTPAAASSPAAASPHAARSPRV